jgi:hypothetical protein
VRGPQLVAGLGPPVRATQPLAVEEVGASELAADARAAQQVDGLAVGALGDITAAQQRT